MFFFHVPQRIYAAAFRAAVKRLEIDGKASLDGHGPTAVEDAAAHAWHLSVVADQLGLEMPRLLATVEAVVNETRRSIRLASLAANPIGCVGEPWGSTSADLSDPAIDIVVHSALGKLLSSSAEGHVFPSTVIGSDGVSGPVTAREAASPNKQRSDASDISPTTVAFLRFIERWKSHPGIQLDEFVESGAHGNYRLHVKTEPAPCLWMRPRRRPPGVHITLFSPEEIEQRTTEPVARPKLAWAQKGPASASGYWSLYIRGESDFEDLSQYLEKRLAYPCPSPRSSKESLTVATPRQGKNLDPGEISKSDVADLESWLKNIGWDIRKISSNPSHKSCWIPPETLGAMWLYPNTRGGSLRVHLRVRGLEQDLYRSLRWEPMRPSPNGVYERFWIQTHAHLDLLKNWASSATKRDQPRT